jgi:hypothetical protein
MSLIDERLETGVINADTTKVYAENTPFLLTMLQDELIPFSEYYKTETINKTDKTDNVGGYQSYTMPSDFNDVFQVIEIPINGEYNEANDYKWEGKTTLLIPDDFVGVYKVVYYPIPNALTAMTDTLVLDDMTCRTTLANGLASRLLTNENKAMANYFGSIYEELRDRAKKKELAVIEQITDLYDSTLTY